MSENLRPSFGERLLNGFLTFMRALARAVLVVLILGLIAGAAYYGIPYVYRAYIQPIEETQTTVAALEAQTSQRLDDLSARVAQLEETNAQLQGRVDALEEKQAHTQAGLEALQGVVDEHGQTLTVLDDLQKQLDDLSLRLDNLEGALSGLQGDTEALQAQLQEAQLGVQPLFRYLRILQAMEHLTRARLFLNQANYGLAEAEVTAARQVLSDLAAQTPPEQAQAVEEVLARLRQTQNRLPDRPVLAVEEMNIAWQMLNELLPALAVPPGLQTATPTPTVGVTTTPTPTPTPNP